ncbi:MAG: Ig-like domain-containing protein, partial [Myxococcota bacterium]|nr:Ig-like domain-containing protein [Myxococcota bacterium]
MGGIEPPNDRACAPLSVPYPAASVLVAFDLTVGPGFPLLFEGRISISNAEAPSTLSLRLTTIPTDLNDRDNARNEVVFEGETELGENGHFEFQLPEVNLNERFNQLSGTELRFTIRLRGQMLNDQFACGDISGEVTRPIEHALDGSTFSMQPTCGRPWAELMPIGRCIPCDQLAEGLCPEQDEPDAMVADAMVAEPDAGVSDAMVAELDAGVPDAMVADQDANVPDAMVADQDAGVPDSAGMQTDATTDEDDASATGGQAAPGCMDMCDAGERRCGSDGPERCMRRDPNNFGQVCTAWQPQGSCNDNEICEAGQCVCGVQNDECIADARRCTADGVEVCGFRENEACLTWLDPIACAAGQSCSFGECRAVDECVDECMEDGVFCVGGQTVHCGDFDADPCLDISAPIACEEGQICSDGACRPVLNCQPDCQLNERRCDGQGVSICVEIEGCPVWSRVEPCESASCAFGECVPVGQSANECDQFGDRVCVADDPRSYRTCGQFDLDMALDLSPPRRCPNGDVCGLNGACTPAAQCEDLCADGDAPRCDGATVVSCAEIDGCYRWQVDTHCLLGQRCSAGQCIPIDEPCIDECADDSLMGTICAGNGLELLTCREVNGCNRLIATQCGANEICPVGGDACTPMNPQDNPGSVTFFVPAVDEIVNGVVGIRIRVEDIDGPLNLNVTANGMNVTAEPLMVTSGDFAMIQWDTTTIDDGDVLLRAVLTDSNGVTTEQARPVVVDNSGPTITITAPQAGQNVVGRLTFTATIADPSGLQSYEMYVGDERVFEQRNIAAGITVLPLPMGHGLPDHIAQGLTPEVVVDLDTFPGLDLANGPQDLVLRVEATDNDGNRTEMSMMVTALTGGVLLAVLEPSLDGGNFPEVSRPFEFVVDANSPRGIQNVVFSIDEMEIGRDDSAPYSVQIDPARVHGMPTMLCGDEDRHQIKIVVTEVGGRETTGVWCARWDTTPPEIRMTAPVFDAHGGAGIVTRDGDDFPIELELEDGDASPSVEVIVNDVPVGQQNEAPYRVTMDGNAILANTDTHDQDVTLLVKATDYLGNEAIIRREVRVSRADWALSLAGHTGTMVVQGSNVTAFGLWNPVDNRARIVALRPALQGGAYWDVKGPFIRSGLRPLEGRFYGDSQALGVLVEVNGDGRGFVRIDEGGNLWELIDVGMVSTFAPGPQQSTYLAFSQPAAVRRYMVDGNLSWTLEFERADSAIQLPDAEVRQVLVLENGDLIIHTAVPSDDATRIGEYDHAAHRVSTAGEALWTREITGTIPGTIYSDGANLMYAKMSSAVGPGGFPDQALSVESIDSQTGAIVWNRAVGVSLNEVSSGLRDDGAFWISTMHLHTGEGQVFAIDSRTGQFAFTAVVDVSAGFTRLGSTIGATAPIETAAGQLAISVNESGGLAPGVSASKIYRLAPDGGVLGVYESRATEQNENGFLQAELVDKMVSAHGRVAAILRVGATGDTRVAHI